MSSLDYCLYSYGDLPLEVSFIHLWYILARDSKSADNN